MGASLWRRPTWTSTLYYMLSPSSGEVNLFVQRTLFAIYPRAHPPEGWLGTGGTV